MRTLQRIEEDARRNQRPLPRRLLGVLYLASLPVVGVGLVLGFLLVPLARGFRYANGLWGEA